MTVQIDQIFKTQAENLWQFLNTPGQGCYIPSYQRAYAWDVSLIATFKTLLQLRG